jgi:hypothetical protein
MAYTNPETCPECGTTYTNAKEANYVARNNICAHCAIQKEPSKGHAYGGSGGAYIPQAGAQSEAYAYWQGLIA